MIQKLRWKFSAIMMSIVTLLLAVIFITLYYTAKMNYVQRSMEALQAAVMENRPADMGRGPSSDRKRPGSSSAPSDNSSAPPDNSSAPPNASSSPPSVRQSRPRRQDFPLLVVDIAPDGVITVIKNQLLNVEDGEAENLISLAAAGQNTASGTMKEQHLRYLSSKRDHSGTVRYVFADIYEEQNSLHWQIIHSVIIGGGSFVLFLLFSILLSKWATRPVAEAWERQRQFVADASHELKTPLTVILSNADMLIHSPEIPEGKNRQRTLHIQAEAVRMKQLVESLLTLARSDSNQTSDVLCPVNLSYIVNSSIMAYEPLMFDSGKRFICHIQEQIQVNGDEKQLRQLSDILLDNACKYSREAGTITVTLERSGTKEALLTVSNEGTPLTRDETDHIFLRFYRADSARSGIPGYGLGLSIARSIVTGHGGKIDVISDGISTNTFSVFLPLYS